MKAEHKRGLGMLAGLLGALGYPLLIYFTIDTFSPKLLSGILLLLVAARLIFVKLQRGGKRPPLKAILPFVAVGLVSAALVFTFNNNLVLLYIPVVVSLMLAGVFLHSRLRPPTIIEHFARMDFPVLPPSAERYCRRVTVAWVAIFLVNALSCYLAAAHLPRAWWLAWTSMGIYVFMGLCFGIEYLIRRTQVAVFDRELKAMNTETDSESAT